MLSIVAGLSAGHKAGLAVVGGLFVLFALLSALVVPARWPGFPGRGLRPFLVATAAFFVGMMLAVYFLAREPSEPRGGEPHALVSFPPA